MSDITVPSLLYFSIFTSNFCNGHQCDFSQLPRPFYIISYIDNGNVIYRGSSATVSLETGDLLFIPLGESYISTWSGNDKMSCLSVFFSFTPDTDPFVGKSFSMQKVKISSNNEIIYLMNKLLHSDDDFSVMSDFFKMCSFLFSELPYSEKPKNSLALKAAITFINEHFKEDFSVKYLSELCHLSESRFYHLFSENMGVSPTTYKNKIIVNHAIQMLKSEPQKSIEEISDEFGFSSSAYFRKIVKKFTGKSPVQIRKSDMI